MASEDVSRNCESRKEEEMVRFTFQTGTLCGLQPLLLPLGGYPSLHPPQQEDPSTDPTKHFSATVTQKSLSYKLDTHSESGVSNWNYPAMEPETLRPWERGAKSAANKEISWAIGDLPLSLETWKFQQTMQMHRQEVANILREIQEAGGQVPSIKVLTEMAWQRLADKASSPKPSLPTRRRLNFDS